MSSLKRNIYKALKMQWVRDENENPHIQANSISVCVRLILSN